MILFLVGGPSAIGKNSFITRLMDEEVMRNRFGIPSDARFLTAKKGDDLKNWKDRIRETYETASSASAVLKWQASMHRSSVEWLSTEFPGIEIRGIFLWLDENIHIERFVNKHQGSYASADPNQAIGQCRKDRKKNRSRFKALGIPTILVDGKSYELIEEPTAV